MTLLDYLSGQKHCISWIVTERYTSVDFGMALLGTFERAQKPQSGDYIFHRFSTAMWKRDCPFVNVKL